MKGILTFNLPEDQADFETAVHANDWRMVVENVISTLRKWFKYGHEYKTPDDVMIAMQDLIYDDLNDRGLKED